MGVGQELHIAHVELGAGNTSAGQLDERLRGVDSERLRAALGNEAEEDPRTAPDVQDPITGLETYPPQRLLVGGELLLLGAGPVVRPCSPEGTPARCAAGLAGVRKRGRHGRSPR